MYYIDFSNIVAKDKKLFKELYKIDFDESNKKVRNKLYKDVEFLNKLKPRKMFVKFANQLKRFQGIELVSDIDCHIIESWLFHNNIDRLVVRNKKEVLNNLTIYDEFIEYSPTVYDKLNEILYNPPFELFDMCRSLYKEYNDTSLVYYRGDLSMYVPKDGIVYRQIELKYFGYLQKKGDKSDTIKKD